MLMAIRAIRRAGIAIAAFAMLAVLGVGAVSAQEPPDVQPQPPIDQPLPPEPPLFLPPEPPLFLPPEPPIFRTPGTPIFVPVPPFLQEQLPGPAAIQPVPPAPPTPVICPIPVEAVQQGIDVCVDRGEGSVYAAGDPITMCVTTNLAQLAIFPPPPPPTIQILNSVDGGPATVIFETAMYSGQECVQSTIVPPTGFETVEGLVIDEAGQVTFRAQTFFRSIGFGFGR
jgi:hypothetical protein